jgi:hypothetical protein
MALAAAFPEYPPFRGEHASIVPHLTIANAGPEPADHAADAASMWLGRNGPIHAVCRSVTLIENSTGMWREMHTFDLVSL